MLARIGPACLRSSSDGDVLHVGLAVLHGAHLARVEIDGHDLAALPREGDRERQANIAEADYTHAGHPGRQCRRSQGRGRQAGTGAQGALCPPPWKR